MPNRFYVVDRGSAHEVADVAQSILRAFREDPLERVLFDVGRRKAIVLRRKRRAITVDGGRGQAAREEEVTGHSRPGNGGLYREDIKEGPSPRL